MSNETPASVDADATISGHEAVVQAVMASFAVIWEPGSVAELRILNVPGQGTVSGYFDEPEKLAQAAALYDGTAPALYVTLNPVDRDLLARACNRTQKYTKLTTSDREIVRRRWILIDCDPVRAAGISSTNAEHDAALARARIIREWLLSEGWPIGGLVLADSGNGAHVLAHVDLPNDQDRLRLVGTVLKALAFRFDDDLVKVDTSVANAARITKLYGTLARKGDATPERPHRRARLVEVPSPVGVVPRVCLEALAATLPKPRERHRTTGKASAAFDLGAWISEHNVPVVREGPWGQGRRYILKPCPWNPAHTNDAAYIVQFPEGAIAAGCHHDGCVDQDWHALRDVYEPGWRERPQRTRDGAGDGIHSRFVLRTDLELEQRPAPPALVEGLLPVGALGIVYGAPADGKSFLALDLALSVATGLPWHGRPVQRGTVLYVAAEGIGGLGVRLLAWKRHHNVSGETGLLFLTEAVQLMEDAVVVDLLAVVREVAGGVVLVVIDTFARCIVGGDENSAKDVGRAIANLDRIRRDLGATVVVIHHTTKAGTVERGSSALRGAADTMIAVGRTGDAISVICDKQKDAEPFPDISLKLEPCPAGNGAVSCVLVPGSEQQGPTGPSLSAAERRCLDVLGQFQNGAGYTAWRKAAGLPESSFRRAMGNLVRNKLVLKTGDGKRTRYVAPGMVEGVLPPTATSPPETATAVSMITATPPHPVGVAVGCNGDGASEILLARPLQPIIGSPLPPAADSSPSKGFAASGHGTTAPGQEPAAQNAAVPEPSPAEPLLRLAAMGPDHLARALVDHLNGRRDAGAPIDTPTVEEP